MQDDAPPETSTGSVPDDGMPLGFYPGDEFIWPDLQTKRLEETHDGTLRPDDLKRAFVHDMAWVERFSQMINKKINALLGRGPKRKEDEEQ